MTQNVEALIAPKFHQKDPRLHWMKQKLTNDVVSIVINFEEETQISMLRIWNYNCSRTRAIRGVRLMAILNENSKVLFYGEIKKASG